MPVISAVVIGDAGVVHVSCTSRKLDAVETKRGARKLPSLHARCTVRTSRHATACPRGARLTLPAFRQRVQTFTFSILPSITVRTT